MSRKLLFPPPKKKEIPPLCVHTSALLETELRGIFLDRLGSKRVINDTFKYYSALGVVTIDNCAYFNKALFYSYWFTESHPEIWHNLCGKKTISDYFSVTH